MYSIYIQLVCGLEHFFLSIIYGLSSFPLTFTYFKMVKNHHQAESVLVSLRLAMDINEWQDLQEVDPKRGMFSG